MDFQILFFFSALGAFNGIIIGLYFLFIAKPKHNSHTFLGWLLLALSVRIGKSVFFYFSDNLADIYIQFGLFACWFIGPLLYHYIRFGLNLDVAIKKKTKIHFALLFLVVAALILGFPRSEYEVLWSYQLVYLIYVQWLSYILVGGYFIVKNFSKISTNKKQFQPFQLWFLSIYVGNFLICLAFITSNYTSYIVGALSFSFVFYLLVLLLLLVKKRNQLIFLDPPKYGNMRIEEEAAIQLINDLEKLMTEKEWFKKSDVSLSMVAKELKVLPTKLSLLLNDNMNINFSNYLNKKRIQEAQKIIRENSDFSYEGIGYDCGFNSKSTFYSAFKKYTGLTPSQYKKSQNS
ncbi:MAG: helix-turn-helix transcriptional regulator [Bacteroidota bacterium]